ncbi:MAG: GNAT family N-acetyltransferase [Verrucomicrobiales bacterium]|nr:GNAT family N-acetyltransferase [Verrucomicrobiales bacterium]
MKKEPSSSAAAPASSPWRIEVLRTEEALRGLQAEWEPLLSEAVARNPFLSWDWTELWWRKMHRQVRRLVVVTARDETGRLDVVLPLMIVPGEGGARRWLRHLHFLGGTPEIEAEGLEPLVRQGTEGALAACWRHALEEAGRDWDTARFRYLDTASPLVAILEQEIKTAGMQATRSQQQISLMIDLPSTWESYLGTRSGNFRKQLKRRNRRAEAEHSLKLHLAATQADVERLFPLLIQLHSQRWTEAQSGFLNPTAQAFHRDLARRWCQPTHPWRVLLMVLEHQGMPVAANYAFSSADQLWDYQGGWMPTASDVQPSKLMQAELVRHAISEGIRRYDFLPGANALKQSWSTTQREVFDLEVFRPGSPRAALFRLLRATRRTIAPPPPPPAIA